MKYMKFAALVVALLALSQLLMGGEYRTPIQMAPASVAYEANPYANSAIAVKAGAKLFQRDCVQCHGENATGRGRAPSLVSSEVRNGGPGAVVWVLRNGSLRRGMPSFAHLPDPQKWQIAAYLQSLQH